MTVDREDILIGRVIDDEASPQDWAELEQLAETDPTVWRRLSLAKREQSALCAGVADALAVADEVELPHHAMHAQHAFNVRWRAWSGWAAAAAIALIWATVQGVLPSSLNNSNGQTAGVDPASWTPDQAFNQYLTTGIEQGRVLGELPTVMVESRPAEDGQSFEIMVMRRVIEVKRVHNAFSVGFDESGQVRLVPTRPDLIAGDPL